MKKGKTDLYSFIHKAQRVHLFDLSSEIGRADFSDVSESQLIKQKVKDIISHLRKHSLHELTFIHPLFTEVGDQALLINEEHDELENELLKLEKILNAEDWAELYPAFNHFIAIYMLHQDEEERAQAEILWKHFDDKRLSAVIEAFKASRTPDMATEDLKFLIPGLSLQELKQMFHGIKTSAPQPAFQAACQIAETCLEPKRWDQLHQSLS